MVKHPKYQAMDDARQDIIPEAICDFCNDEYKIKRSEPYSKSQHSHPLNPRPRPTFEIINTENKRVAIFYPNGYSECFDKEFKTIYDKIVLRIKEVANRALTEFENKK